MMTPEFTIHGAREIRLVAVAIGNEIEKLKDFIKNSWAYDDDAVRGATRDLAIYCELLIEMGDPR